MKNATSLRRPRTISTSTLLKFFLPFLFLVSLASAQSDRDPSVPVTIPGTETLTLTSQVNDGQEYALYVQLPQGYSASTVRYPVIYVLDAQWDFPLVTSIYGQQYYDGFIPSAIIVGITWGGKNPKHDSLRSRDLTPTHNSRIPQSGNGATFLKTIKSEIIPLIETRYRSLPSERALMGSSFGGLFTLYAMFQEPGLFNRYALTSPALGWDGEAIVETEDDFADETKSLPVRLFMAQGELEGGVQNFTKFAATIESRGYGGLQMQTRIIEGAGHSGGKAEGYTRGLQWVFAWPKVSLDPKTLDRYEGEYQVTPNLRAKVWRADSVLMAALPGGGSIPLLAKSEAEFYVRGFFLHVRFEMDAQGAVTGLVAEEYQRTTRAPKVR